MAIAQKLLNAVTVTGASAELVMDLRYDEGKIGVVEIDITGTSASVNIEGRTDAAGTWIVIATYTSNTAVGILFMPRMRLNVTAINAATVNGTIVGTPAG